MGRLTGCLHTPACPAGGSRWQCAMRTDLEGQVRAGVFPPLKVRALLGKYGLPMTPNLMAPPKVFTGTRTATATARDLFKSEL